jgi:nucleoside-diphosphate-sugar epimerase
MNILITGGTGFIGSTLCSRLLEEGNNKIVILSRHSEKIKPPIKYDCQAFLLSRQQLPTFDITH